MQKMSGTNASVFFQHTFLAHETMWLTEVGFCLPHYQVLPLLLDKIQGNVKSTTLRKIFGLLSQILTCVQIPVASYSVDNFFFFKSLLFLMVMLKWTKDISQSTSFASQMAIVIFELEQSDFWGRGGHCMEELWCPCLVAAAFLGHTALATTKEALIWPNVFIFMSCIRCYAPSAPRFPFLCPPLLSVG